MLHAYFVLALCSSHNLSNILIWRWRRKNMQIFVLNVHARHKNIKDEQTKRKTESTKMYCTYAKSKLSKKLNQREGTNNYLYTLKKGNYALNLFFLCTITRHRYIWNSHATLCNKSHQCLFQNIFQKCHGWARFCHFVTHIENNVYNRIIPSQLHSIQKQKLYKVRVHPAPLQCKQRLSISVYQCPVVHLPVWANK